MRTTILLDHEPTGAGHVVRALLKLEGDAPAAVSRAPLNLAVVLDRSGSMSGPKLVAARTAAAQLVRRLGLEDVVSVVAYDEEVTVITEPVTGTAAPDLATRISRIQPGGMTNLSGGWLRGREFVRRHLAEGTVNRVLLMTDGLANVGVLDREQLVGMCLAAKQLGVSTTTIGFGQDYDEVLLRGMADAGGGNAYYIERPDQATAIFADELEGLLGLAAQNLRVAIRPAPAVALAAVHHDYPRASSADATLTLELGDLYAREPRSLLCEFLAGDVCSAGSGPCGPVPVATLVVTADVLREGGLEHQRIELPITFAPAEGPQVNAEVRRELLLLEAARARRDAHADAERGDYVAGRTRLARASASLLELDASDEVVREEASDLACMAQSYAEGQVSAADRKYLYQRSYNRATGRAAKDELIRRKREQEE